MDGDWVGMIGLGTLMSEASAKTTSPHARDFSLCQVRGFRRVFAFPSHHQLNRGPPFWIKETDECAALTAEPWEGARFAGCYFQVPREEFTAIQSREDMFKLVMATVQLAGDGGDREGWLCSSNTDEEMRASMGEEGFQDKYGRHGIDKVWSWEGPILPSRPYLRHCVLAIGNQGGEAAREAFLDDTFLWDRRTTVREHLAANPTLMDEQPPPEWAHKFNG